jgi:hypothetical protein
MLWGVFPGLGRLVSVQDLMMGLRPHPRLAVGAMPALLAVFLWSVIDARTSAR